MEEKEAISVIRFEDFTMEAAGMGAGNPLADFYNIAYIHATHQITDRVTPEESQYIGKGMIHTILPYTMQDNYNRDRQPRVFKAAVLENAYLKAVFLPELGGRLWSLFDKEHNKELLYVNPVFQPGNLAIRNAWFSGGVEFNVGIKGHNMLTCDPLFARVATTAEGEEVLQLYEWERVRGMVFGINAYLPEDSRVLYIRDTVENLCGSDSWTYWWSNIAVPETPKTRVIAPCTESFISFYEDGNYILDKTSIPYHNGTDATYPVNHKRVLDFFFKIPPESTERWVTAVEADGIGLAQMSTREMKGRKLFVWGQGSGGKNWGSFLSNGQGTYIEIQAGLAYNQLEHVPMPSGASWSWTEGYAGIRCDTQKVYSTDWNTAVDEVSSQIHHQLGSDDIHGALERAVPTEFTHYRVLQYGSGFGALEELARKQALSRIYDFYPQSMNGMQAQWQQLLERGFLPHVSPDTEPVSYAKGTHWVSLLEQSAETEAGNHWYTHYQLGVAYHAMGETEKSQAAFLRSAACEENCWSLRNLAMLAKHRQDYQTAAAYMEQAIAKNSTCVNLYIDYCDCMDKAQRYAQLVSRFQTFPKAMQSRSRIRLYYAMAHMGLGNYPAAAEVVNRDFILEDVREGELSVSHVWFALYRGLIRQTHPQLEEAEVIALQQQRYPLPSHLDFRMNV